MAAQARDGWITACAVVLRLTCVPSVALLTAAAAASSPPLHSASTGYWRARREGNLVSTILSSVPLWRCQTSTSASTSGSELKQSEQDNAATHTCKKVEYSTAHTACQLNITPRTYHSIQHHRDIAENHQGTKHPSKQHSTRQHKQSCQTMHAKLVGLSISLWHRRQRHEASKRVHTSSGVPTTLHSAST